MKKRLAELFKADWPAPLALWAFLASGIFTVILSSPNVLGIGYSSDLGIFLYLTPWILLWLGYAGRLITDKPLRPEITLLVILIFLGGLNVLQSDDPSRSFRSMPVFLLSGVVTLWVSMFLLTEQRRRRLFDWFCCGCLAVVALGEIVVVLAKCSDWLAGCESFSVFTIHTIPLGTMLLLLSTGPLQLWASDSPKLKRLGGGLLLLGFIDMLLTQKRGTFLAITAMALAGAIYRRRRLGYLLLAGLLLLGLLIPFKGVTAYRALDPTIQSHFNILYRVEMYPFAWHIFQKHPLLGIGLRPITHERYLPDYQQHTSVQNLGLHVKQLQTFDNMLLTAFVELGTLITLTYMGLVGYILLAYIRHVGSLAVGRGEALLRLLPLLGFAIHSLTYDSLVFPGVNWLFHAELGMLAAMSRAGLPERAGLPPPPKAMAAASL